MFGSSAWRNLQSSWLRVDESQSARGSRTSVLSGFHIYPIS